MGKPTGVSDRVRANRYAVFLRGLHQYLINDVPIATYLQLPKLKAAHLLEKIEAVLKDHGDE